MQAAIPEEHKEQAQLMGNVAPRVCWICTSSGHQAARHGPLSAVRESSELCLCPSAVAHMVPFRARRGVTWVASTGLVGAVWRTRRRTKAPFICGGILFYLFTYFFWDVKTN